MKSIAIALLALGITLPAAAQQQPIAGIVKCQRACCNPDKRKSADKIKLPVAGSVSNASSAVPARISTVRQAAPAPTATWSNFHGESPVIITGTTGNVNVSLFYGDTAKKRNIAGVARKEEYAATAGATGKSDYVSMADIDRTVRSILEESRIEQAVKQPFIERKPDYVEALKRCAGFPLPSTRFKYQDFSREDNAKKRAKRIMKKTSLVPPAIVESDYLFASINSPLAKTLTNVFNTDAGVIIINWVSEKTADEPSAGHWVADFKLHKLVVDDLSKDVRIFWQERG